MPPVILQLTASYIISQRQQQYPSCDRLQYNLFDFSSGICHVDDINIFNATKLFDAKSSGKMQTLLEFLEFKGPLVNDVTFRKRKLQGIRNLETFIHVASFGK